MSLVDILNWPDPQGLKLAHMIVFGLVGYYWWREYKKWKRERGLK